MAIEDWIDEVTRVFEIGDGRGGTVKSYRVYERDEWPEALGAFPCALTYVVEEKSYYGTGSPLKDSYLGRTEFHLCDNVNKSNYPFIMRFFRRIRDAAAGHMTLKNAAGVSLVDHFLLRLDEPSIQGPVVMTYGAEKPHLGLLVNWEVKEDVADEYQPSA